MSPLITVLGFQQNANIKNINEIKIFFLTTLFHKSFFIFKLLTGFLIMALSATFEAKALSLTGFLIMALFTTFEAILSSFIFPEFLSLDFLFQLHYALFTIIFRYAFSDLVFRVHKDVRSRLPAA